jgi:hypothetical protein
MCSRLLFKLCSPLWTWWARPVQAPDLYEARQVVAQHIQATSYQLKLYPPLVKYHLGPSEILHSLLHSRQALASCILVVPKVPCSPWRGH